MSLGHGFIEFRQLEQQDKSFHKNKNTQDTPILKGTQVDQYGKMVADAAHKKDPKEKGHRIRRKRKRKKQKKDAQPEVSEAVPMDLDSDSD